MDLSEIYVTHNVKVQTVLLNIDRAACNDRNESDCLAKQIHPIMLSLAGKFLFLCWDSVLEFKVFYRRSTCVLGVSEFDTVFFSYSLQFVPSDISAIWSASCVYCIQVHFLNSQIYSHSYKHNWHCSYLSLFKNTALLITLKQ